MPPTSSPLLGSDLRDLPMVFSDLCTYQTSLRSAFGEPGSGDEYWAKDDVFRDRKRRKRGRAGCKPENMHGGYGSKDEVDELECVWGPPMGAIPDVRHEDFRQQGGLERFLELIWRPFDGHFCEPLRECPPIKEARHTLPEFTATAKVKREDRGFEVFKVRPRGDLRTQSDVATTKADIRQEAEIPVTDRGSGLIVGLSAPPGPGRPGTPSSKDLNADARSSGDQQPLRQAEEAPSPQYNHTAASTKPSQRDDEDYHRSPPSLIDNPFAVSVPVKTSLPLGMTIDVSEITSFIEQDINVLGNPTASASGVSTGFWPDKMPLPDLWKDGELGITDSDDEPNKDSGSS
ncbi:hypothetical protein EV182_000162 [Spiromyces aspiralis]|uniref:Uncharacterized protein n=1 Tax=Spiromyces aspiralis TaxID=68401 RepID=A0ACC1HIE8_9FUNG|nr:hypothetical protein EV182_000162 [Spiromyces aspiralis]